MSANPLSILLLLWLLSPLALFTLWLIERRRLRRRISDSDVENETIRALLRTAQSERDHMEAKYAPIIDQDAEVSRLREQAVKTAALVDEIRTSYAEKRVILDRLEKQIAVYDERLAFSELGMYEPHFEFTDSEEYKLRIHQVRDRQKAMISSKSAAICPTQWQVEGSVSKGQVMINRQTRLTMRAFNNECEAAIANVRWNNVVAMERRILASAAAINKENTSLNLVLSDAYVALKVDELRLTHEHRERLKSEKEERAELARAEREERKLLAEADAAEREERKFEMLVERARKEAAAGDEQARRKIAVLESALAEAHAKSERARAMAEMTRSGYVYIISNVGSFGDEIVKIGLTRRLDPDDRVRELGDASVPFAFDVHAMIYSDEAPAIEAALHREFADRRINLSNFRKEFFRVSLDEVEEALSRVAPSASSSSRSSRAEMLAWA